MFPGGDEKSSIFPGVKPTTGFLSKALKHAAVHGDIRQHQQPGTAVASGGAAEVHEEHRAADADHSHAHHQHEIGDLVI